MNNQNINEEEITEEINIGLKKLIYPPDIQNEYYSVASWMENASNLGGDLYNQVIDKDGNHWFAIGDASGHDINSHLFSMMIMVKMNQYINVTNSPKEVSELINKELVDQKKLFSFNLSSYASLAILKADKYGNFAHYGQHPSYIVHRQKTHQAEVISTSGKFIGLDIRLSDDDQENTFQLHSGDKLYLFTDGLFEQRNKAGKFFGYRLYQFIENKRSENVRELSRELYNEIMVYSNNIIDDDMTLMIIEKK